MNHDGSLPVPHLPAGDKSGYPSTSSGQAWRRLLLRSDQTIADFHYALQIAMGWSDLYLHRFVIHGKEFGVAHIGSMGFDDNPHRVRLSDFRFRQHEWFLYEYYFGDLWQHEIRLEQKTSEKILAAAKASGNREDFEEQLSRLA